MQPISAVVHTLILASKTRHTQTQGSSVLDSIIAVVLEFINEILHSLMSMTGIDET